MGVFNVTMEIGDPAGQEFVELDAMVDTGSTHTTVPESLLNSLRVVAEDVSRFELGDSRIVEYRVGYTRMRYNGKSAIVPVVFAPDAVSPLIGATTLEILGLAVNTVKQQLVPVNFMLRQESDRLRGTL